MEQCPKCGAPTTIDWWRTLHPLTDEEKARAQQLAAAHVSREALVRELAKALDAHHWQRCGDLGCTACVLLTRARKAGLLSEDR